MAATPLMTTVVPTPPSPLHGGRYDTYHATRKSTRQTTTRTSRAIQTPPLLAIDLSRNPTTSPKKNSNTSQSTEHLNSPPSSTHTSPRKQAKRDSRTEATSSMDGNDFVLAPPEDPFYDPTDNPTLQQPSLNLGANMLPTPVKTPRKKPIGQAGLHAGGRVLFPDRAGDPMPTPRKNRKGKRHVGFSLYSSLEDGNAGAENEISIFTDSKDKVPELDPSEDNPFLENATEASVHPEPTKGRGSRKRKAPHGLDGNKDIEEIFNREEGMVYVFRGKKVYRRFPSEEPEAEESNGAVTEDANHDNYPTNSLTRASIKPRLLFPPTASKTNHSKTALEEAEEEAPTDIDDPDATETEHEHELTPEKRTPVKPSFHGLAPDTPPDTGHATRSATKKAAMDGGVGGGSGLPSSPAISPVKLDFNKHFKGKKSSPFDSWARTKPGSAVAAGRGVKRAAEDVDEDDGKGGHRLGETSAKRAKATVAAASL